MPTKKRRVGFIPRTNVLEIINKLSYESNLSNSKIINILVEEALYKRGILNKKTDKNIISSKYQKPLIKENEILSDKNVPITEYENSILETDNLYQKETYCDPLDSEIYKKFLLFLEFQEKMKKHNFK
tara:strand:- start:61 stop:444 length:384 start_codon:yes stop_codon:yes gene_type:complete